MQAMSHPYLASNCSNIPGVREVEGPRCAPSVRSVTGSTFSCPYGLLHLDAQSSRCVESALLTSKGQPSPHGMEEHQPGCARRYFKAT